MKTLVALSALLAVSFAAPPALNWDSTQKVPEKTIRDKKSATFPMGHGFPVTTGVISPGFGHPGFGHGIISQPEHFLPHFGFRDAEGKESTESGESSCMKKMKVKLCKADKIKTDAIGSEENIVNRLEMARAVVEDLERDLEQMENHPSAKMTQWKQADGMEAELREDVEIAKQALDHIKSHFGNLESMNLQQASMKEEKSIPEEKFEMGHTEEERLAQWKSALEKIQQNAEMMRSIEETFKGRESEFDTPEDEKFSLTDEKAAMDTDLRMVQWKAALENIQKNTQIMKKIQDEVKLESSHNLENTQAKEADVQEHKSDIEINGENQSRETGNEESLNKPEDITDEMKTSATEIRESNVATEKVLSSSIPETVKVSSSEESSIESKSFKFVSPAETKKMESLSLRKEETENKPKEVETTIENTQPFHLQEARMEAAPSELIEARVDANEEHLSKNEDITREETLHQAQEKAAETEPMHAQSTSSVVQNVEEKEHTPKVKATNEEENLTTSIKEVENVLHHNKEQSHLKQPNENKFEKETMMKASEVNDLMFRSPHNEESSTDSGSHGPSQVGFQNQGNMRGHLGHHHGKHHFHPHHDMSGSHSMQHHEFSNHFPSSKSSFPPSHGQMHQQHGQSFPLHGQKTHENLAMHGKAVDFNDGMTHAASMSDTPMRAPMDHNMRWSHTHGSARGAYGSPSGYSSGLSIGGPSAASGGSAPVGVFPNAHVSDCAIPLLLSCAPNVVQGQLAKSHASYSAPAYRSDEFNFLNKREAQKLDTEIKNVPIKKIQKQFDTIKSPIKSL